MFTIRQREITFTTTDIYEQDGIYYKAVTDELGDVTYEMLSSRLDSFIYSDDFAEGDVFYVTSLLFNDLRTGDLETENSVILDSIVIWNTERDCDVTYNYKFVTNWGKLYKLL